MSGCNEVINYGTSLSLGLVVNNSDKYGISHSITLTGLASNTTYYYNYTSCDFVGNCNSSYGSLITATPGQPPRSSGTSAGCVPYYFECNDWSSCINELQSRT